MNRRNFNRHGPHLASNPTPLFMAEALERRTLLAAVSWTGAVGDNNWNTPGNWSANAVPNGDDDVTIDVPGSATIYVFSSQSIRSLTTAENVRVGYSGGRQVYSTLLRLTHGLTLKNDATLTISPTYNFQGVGVANTLAFDGPQTLGGEGKVLFGGGGYYPGDISTLAASSLTIDPGVTIGAEPNSYGGIITGSITNQGLISGGAVETRITGTLTNNGTVGQVGNIAFNFSQYHPGTGILSAQDNATIYLNGQVNQAGLGRVLNRLGSPGIIVKDGILTGGLILNAMTGSWGLDHATMMGGFYNAEDGASLQVLGDSTLDGVSVAATLSVHYGRLYGNPRTTTLTIKNDLELVGNANIRVEGSIIEFVGGRQKLIGAGEVIFESSPGNTNSGLRASGFASDGPASVDIEAGITIRSRQGFGELGQDGVETRIRDAGLVVVSDGRIEIKKNFSCYGTVRVEGDSVYISTLIYNGPYGLGTTFDVRGGSLRLGGDVAQGSLGKLQHTGGQVLITGRLTGDVTLNSTTGSWDISGGTFSGGTYRALDGAVLRSVAPNGAILDGVTIASDFQVVDAKLVVSNTLTFVNNAKVLVTNSTGSSPTAVYIGGSSLLGRGELVLDQRPGGISLPVFVTVPSLTIAPGVTIRSKSGSAYFEGDATIANGGLIAQEVAGASLEIQTRLINHGVVRVTQGTLKISNAIGGTGAYEVRGGILSLGGTFTQAGLGNLIHTGGNFDLSGTLTGGLALNAATGSWNLAGGRLSGGTYSATGGATLHVVGEGKLDGVTVASDLDVFNSVLGITGGLTLANNAAIHLNGTNSTPASLDFRDGSQALSGQGEVRFEGGAGSASMVRAVRYTSNSAASLTIGPDVTVRTSDGNGTVGGGGRLTSVTNSGTISAESAGRILSFKDTVSNTGKLLASNGASLTAAGSFDNSGVLTLGPGTTFNIDGAFGTSGVVNFQIGGSAASGKFGRIQANGGLILGGTANIDIVGGYHPAVGEVFPLVQYTSATGSFSTVNGLALDGITLFTLSPTATAFRVTATGEVYRPSGHVTGIFVSGSSWTPAFLQALSASGLGDVALGYRLGGGGALGNLPWTNLDRISVRFDHAVNADLDDLKINGMRTPTLTAASVSLDPATNTATWTLPRPLAADAIVIDLSGQTGGVSVADGGRLIDGDNLGQSPSGDGTDGGDFRLRANLLPGDVNQSGGAVAANDLVLTRNRQGRSISTPPGSITNGYSVLNDVNGDGVINASDLVLVRNRIGSTLPTVADFNYSNFSSSTTGLDLFGDTAASDGILHIVPASERHSGAVRRRGAQALGLGFTTSFTFHYANVGGILDDSGNHGTDGIAFTIQPEGSGQPVLAGTGVSVWFDAYRDGAEPSSSRVGIYRNGGLLAQFDVEALGIRFREGGPHTAQIDYSGSSLSVQLDGQRVGRIAVNLGSTGLVGFAGFSGQAYADQQLLSWSFRPTALPGSAALFAIQTPLRFAPQTREEVDLI